MAEFYVRFDETRRPVTGVKAFERVNEDTVQQQAAVMLLLGQQLRGDPQAFRARARAARTAQRVEIMTRQDREEFPVPKPRPRPTSPRRGRPGERSTPSSSTSRATRPSSATSRRRRWPGSPPITRRCSGSCGSGGDAGDVAGHTPARSCTGRSRPGPTGGSRAGASTRISGTRSARLFACQALWRELGVKGAGRALVHALGSGDEDLRAMAGMFPVQGGPRAVPRLREGIEQRRHLPLLLRIAGDVGARELTPEIERFTADADPAVARAARDALRLLAAS
jgi:hypothetical protein